MKIPINQIMNGDCLEHLKELPEKSINMCMTSPPYWALRDYGVKGQLGLEPTFDEYINKLCNIFDEVKRVLRDDGTCWVNIGDTYSATRWTNNTDTGQPMNNFKDGHRGINPIKETGNMPDKCLVMIPFRFAIEMVNRGWILRNTIIWHKRSCMPSSVKDRFTVDFEYLFLFSKNKKYYFEKQYEGYSKATMDDSRFNPGSKKNHTYDGKTEHQPNELKIKAQRGGFKQGNEKGRNKRTVWAINPKPFKEAHFAVYPEELCETPIKAGCPEFVCVKCGKPREKIIEYERKNYISREDRQVATGGAVKGGVGKNFPETTMKEKGYTDCGCNAKLEGGIVLDPFFGAGTTGVVALKQDKKFIGIELNPEYIKIAQARLKPHLEQRKL